MIMMSRNKNRRDALYQFAMHNQVRHSPFIAEKYSPVGKSPSELVEDDAVSTANQAAFNAFIDALGSKDHKTGMKAFKEMMSLSSSNKEYYGEEDD